MKINTKTNKELIESITENQFLDALRPSIKDSRFGALFTLNTNYINAPGSDRIISQNKTNNHE